MKEVPNRLQCSYCIRNQSHGGECRGQDSPSDIKGCLVFEIDPRGCIRNSDFKIAIAIYQEFPLLNTWDSRWQVHDVDSEVRVRKIYGITWNTKAGKLIVHCNCDYFVNEYHDDYAGTEEKTVLKIIK